MSLKIGSVECGGRLILAPLAGYTDVAFRRLALECGAAFAVSEMVSAKGLCYGSANTLDLLKTHSSEKPSCVQLFGAEPEFLYRAVLLPQLDKFDIIDFNMGCPVKKITSNGEGSALMGDEKAAAAAIAALVRAASQKNKPLSVKMRLGRTATTKNALSIARVAQQEGAAAVTIHGRTADMFYSGRADWDEIADIAAKLTIPVIGNGDIKSYDEAVAKLDEYKLDGVMIGRGAVGRPDIFTNQPQSIEQRQQLIMRHIDYMLMYFGDRYTLVNMRKHLPEYLRGYKGIKEFKREINSITCIQTLKQRLQQFFVSEE